MYKNELDFINDIKNKLNNEKNLKPIICYSFNSEFLLNLDIEKIKNLAKENNIIFKNLNETKTCKKTFIKEWEHSKSFGLALYDF